MISPLQFYISIGILCGIIIFSIYSTNNSIAEIEKNKMDTKDSIYEVQRDSAFRRARNFELQADSFQAIVNRKKLDLQNIKKKYDADKKNVLVMGADSTLALFQRSIQGTTH